jgi:DNA primase
MFESITKACRYLLCNYPDAGFVQEYLDSRIKRETQELFQFGYYPGIDKFHLLTDLLGEDLFLKHKLIWPKNIEDSLGPRTVNFSYFDYYPLMMPFQDTYGDIVGLVGRTFLDDKEMKNKKIPKYKNTTPFKKGNYLFGLWHNKQEIIDQNCVYIVEGQFDVMKAMEKGIKNIVGIGTSTLSSYQFSVISRYTSNLIMILDNDDAGVKGRKSATTKFGQFANIQNFYIPESYKDIDEYLTKCDGELPSFIIKD